MSNAENKSTLLQRIGNTVSYIKLWSHFDAFQNIVMRKIPFECRHQKLIFFFVWIIICCSSRRSQITLQRIVDRNLFHAACTPLVYCLILVAELNIVCPNCVPATSWLWVDLKKFAYCKHSCSIFTLNGRSFKLLHFRICIHIVPFCRFRI